jgi:Fe-S cluster assembly protein SufB
LNEETVRQISAELDEPAWMLEKRLASLELFYSMPMPTRGPDLSSLDFNELVYYASPEQRASENDWSKVDPAIKAKFEKL